MDSTTWWERFQELVKNLDQKEEKDCFKVCFALRNPPSADGAGRRGVRHRNLVLCYLQAMGRLARTLTGQPFNWKVEHRPRSVPVYVCDLAYLSKPPFTYYDSSRGIFICLPCRSSEPSLTAARHRAAIEGIHEGTHAYTFCARPPLRKPSETLHQFQQRSDVNQSWLWFHEATAVAMESYILPDNPESYRFAMDWSDSPEVSFDRKEAWYTSGMFARYLMNRTEPEIISKMWNESGDNDQCFEMLNRLLNQTGLGSATPDLCPIFADYATDSYFHFDIRSPGFAPDVYFRFRGRALTRSLSADSPTDPITGYVDHLASRYYRIDPSPGVTALEFRLSSPGGSIIADAAVVTRKLAMGAKKRLGATAVSLDLNERDGVDHLVMSVANIGTNRSYDHTDFEIAVRAVS